MSDFANRLLGRPDAAPVRPLLPSRFEPVTPLRHVDWPAPIEVEAVPEPAAPPTEQAEATEPAPGERRPAEKRPTEKAPAHQPGPLRTPRSGRTGAQPVSPGERTSHPAGPTDSTLRTGFPVETPRLPAASAGSPSEAMPREPQPRWPTVEKMPARQADPPVPGVNSHPRPDSAYQPAAAAENSHRSPGSAFHRADPSHQAAGRLQDIAAAVPDQLDPPAAVAAEPPEAPESPVPPAATAQESAASRPLPHPTRAHAVAPPAPRTWLPTPDHAPESEPVVHITIGRVEVRAAAETAPAPRSPRRRQALGLDEYLRRKAGG